MDNIRILDVTVSFVCPRCDNLTFFTTTTASNAFSLEGGVEYCICCGLLVEWFVNLVAKPVEKANG